MPKFLDLTGQIYGELTVIEMLRNYNNTKRTYCKCLGVDGNIYIIRQDALQSGASKHIKGVCHTGKPINILGKKFGLLTVLNSTENRSSNGSIIWSCICDCGKCVNVPLGSLMRGHTTSCGCKKKSTMEIYIMELLNDLEIKYQVEKTFDDLINPISGMKLYFDFYLYDYNVVIEYDSELHYMPVKAFGGEEDLKNRRERDKIKDLYCKEHNIKMIRIPYTVRKENIKQIIREIIQPVTITA